MISGRPYLTAATALILGAVVIGAAVAFWPERAPERSAARDEQATMMVRLLKELAEISDAEAFERPSGPWDLTLPDDYGGHPSARAESWMIAAHLENEDGDPLGLTFFLSRFGIRAGDPAPGSSAWDIRALYGAQVTLAGAGEPTARAEQRLSRGAGAAGHDREAREVWLDNWQLTYGNAQSADGLMLTASVEGMPVSLTLTPVKAARRSGGDDQAPIRGFAVPRMAVEGSVGLGPTQRAVSGLAWLDRLWGDLPLPGGPLAYDRMILQLDDGTDVSLLRSQRRDGRGGSTLDGMIFHSDGNVETLTETAIDLTEVAHRRPDGGGPAYAVGWQVDGRGLDLRIAPLIESRRQGFVLGGWNGIVTVSGRHNGREVSGLGTLQLTGYEER